MKSINTKISVLGALLAILSAPANALVLKYEVFNTAFSDVPVGTIITVDLGFAGGLPGADQYNPGATSGPEDIWNGSILSEFEDLATVSVSFLGRSITGVDGNVSTFAATSPTGSDSFSVIFGEGDLSGDLGFDSFTQSPPPRIANGLKLQFVGPEGTINDQYIETALDVVVNDPLAWSYDAGNGLATKAPRRLQFSFGPPGLPEINATLVPIPAAVWLFGSALAGLGWMRRRQTA
ncbi:MAG: VPLPA-CTERM sorting domain-containing protein [Gammaproteobacteria bacterium]